MTTREQPPRPKGTKKKAHVDGDRERRLRRLKRIEGQVRGLQKMVASDRWCPDVVAQIRSVEAALRSLEADLMRGHLAHCARRALTSDDEDARSAMVDELVALLARR